jgi:hypothetical protein
MRKMNQQEDEDSPKGVKKLLLLCVPGWHMNYYAPWHIFMYIFTLQFRKKFILFLCLIFMYSICVQCIYIYKDTSLNIKF